jgi:endothelin-converting enzyme
MTVEPATKNELTNILKHSYFSPARLSIQTKSEDEENFLKMKSAYDACLDEETIKKLGTAPLLKVVEQIREIFPVDESSKSWTQEERSNAITKTVLYLTNNGISALLSPGTGADDRDPDVVVVSVSAPYRIGLPAKERYEDDKLVRKYQMVVEEVLAALVSDGSKESFGSVIELEKKLAAASPTEQERQDVTVSRYIRLPTRQKC